MAPPATAAQQAERWLTQTCICLQYVYEGEEPAEVLATATLKDGVDIHGTALLKCARAVSLATILTRSHMDRSQMAGPMQL